MTIKSKPELFQLILDNLPSTNAKFITATRIREVFDDFVASNLALNVLNISSSPINVAAEVDLILVKAGADIINLVSIADHKERALLILNVSGLTVTANADGSDTVGGFASLAIPDKSAVIFTVDGTNWDDTLTSRRRVSLTFTDESNALVTTINTAGVFEDINCTLGAAGPSGEFSVSGNQITWNGAYPIIIEVDWSFSGLVDQNDNEVAGKVIKNFGLGSEVILDGRVTSAFHTTKSNVGTLFTRTNLITGDILHFVVANLDSGIRDITVSDQTGQIDEIR